MKLHSKEELEKESFVKSRSLEDNPKVFIPFLVKQIMNNKDFIKYFNEQSISAIEDYIEEGLAEKKSEIKLTQQNVGIKYKENHLNRNFVTVTNNYPYSTYLRYIFREVDQLKMQRPQRYITTNIFGNIIMRRDLVLQLNTALYNNLLTTIQDSGYKSEIKTTRLANNSDKITTGQPVLIIYLQ